VTARTLADAGYLIGDFTVIKLEAESTPLSDGFGSLEEIDLSAVSCMIGTPDWEDGLAKRT